MKEYQQKQSNLTQKLANRTKELEDCQKKQDDLAIDLKYKDLKTALQYMPKNDYLTTLLEFVAK